MTFYNQINFLVDKLYNSEMFLNDECMSATVTLTAHTTPCRYTHTHTHRHSFFKFIRSTAGDETSSSQPSSHLAPCDFPTVCLLQSALFIPEPKYDCKLQSAKDCILNALCNKWFRPWDCGEQGGSSWRGGTEEEARGRKGWQREEVEDIRLKVKKEKVKQRGREEETGRLEQR